MDKQQIKYIVTLQFHKGKRVIKRFKSVNQLRAFVKYVRSLNTKESIDKYTMYLEFCIVTDTTTNLDKSIKHFLY